MAFIGVKIAIFGYSLAFFFDLEIMYIILFVFGQIALGFMVISVFSAFTYDFQRRNESHGIAG